ncbi:MAG: hypothetical protein ACT4O2_01175 [Beijerinckiaceae bacterium]
MAWTEVNLGDFDKTNSGETYAEHRRRAGKDMVRQLDLLHVCLYVHFAPSKLIVERMAQLPGKVPKTLR